VVDTHLLEDQARTCGHSSHGAAGQYLSGSRHRGDVGSDVNRDPTPFLTTALAFARMQADSNPYAVDRERPHHIQPHCQPD